MSIKLPPHIAAFVQAENDHDSGLPVSPIMPIF
jgi:hypothetical protein